MQQKGLYNNSYEHDSCGVGMVVNIHGGKTHQLVDDALKVLENMRHRGAEVGKDGDVIYNTKAAQQVADALGVELPEKGSTRMGKCTFQQSADGSVTAVVS